MSDIASPRAPGSRAEAGRIRDRPAQERERLADRIADVLDVPMTAAGVVFLLLVVAETVSSPHGAVGTVFTVASWVLWVAFVGEFVLRLVIAPSAARYLRRNWWQLLFLSVPFLRFLRALRVARAARIGRVVSSAVRSGRTAGRRLSSRLALLGVVTLIVVLASSQLLFETGEFGDYADSLHAATLATVAGEPLQVDGALARLLEVVLLVYSVAVFATLAGSVGAFLLERNRADAEAARSVNPGASVGTGGADESPGGRR